MGWRVAPRIQSVVAAKQPLDSTARLVLRIPAVRSRRSALPGEPRHPALGTTGGNRRFGSQLLCRNNTPTHRQPVALCADCLRISDDMKDALYFF